MFKSVQNLQGKNLTLYYKLWYPNNALLKPKKLCLQKTEASNIDFSEHCLFKFCTPTHPRCHTDTSPSSLLMSASLPAGTPKAAFRRSFGPAVQDQITAPAHPTAFLQQPTADAGKENNPFHLISIYSYYGLSYLRGSRNIFVPRGRLTPPKCETLMHQLHSTRIATTVSNDHWTV